MIFSKLFEVKQADRHKFVTKIIDSSAPRDDFYFLVILSTAIVALGLLADNIILVIGGMLVTPLLSPILVIALGIIISDGRVIQRSLRIFLISFTFAFAVAFILGIFIPEDLNKLKLIQVMQPSLFTFFVAIVAGFAASYSWAKPGLDGTLPGVAVTVTLIPPLTAIGLALSHLEFELTRDVFSVLLLNVFGITMSSLIVFSLMEFFRAKKKVIEEIKEEEKQIETEKQKNHSIS